MNHKCLRLGVENHKTITKAIGLSQDAISKELSHNRGNEELPAGHELFNFMAATIQFNRAR